MVSRGMASDRLLSGQSRRSEAAMLAFAGTLLSAVLLIVISSNMEPADPVAELQSLSEDDNLDARYLAAATAGSKGKEFVQRLQDMWFIEANGERTCPVSCARKPLKCLGRARTTRNWGAAMMPTPDDTISRSPRDLCPCCCASYAHLRILPILLTLKLHPRCGGPSKH
jgi:hypothetical protein